VERRDRLGGLIHDYSRAAWRADASCVTAQGRGATRSSSTPTSWSLSTMSSH